MPMTEELDMKIRVLVTEVMNAAPQAPRCWNYRAGQPERSRSSWHVQTDLWTVAPSPTAYGVLTAGPWRPPLRWCSRWQ